jgi:hypothetical protein
MFWKNKQKCPIKDADKEWIEYQLNWINLNVISLAEQETFLPTKKYFNWNFEGEEKDAEFILRKVGEYCNVNVEKINLEFYSEEAIELDRGTITQQVEGTGTAGQYVQEGDQFSILIEVQQLKKPNSLISTIVHELCHYVLIGLKEFSLEGEENEWLTDVLAIAYGFGIFIGNTKFEFSQWQSGDGWGGWQYSIQGYLPQQIIAHVMAEIEIRRTNSLPQWTNLLKGNFQKDFEKSMNYLLLIHDIE